MHISRGITLHLPSLLNYFQSCNPGSNDLIQTHLWLTVPLWYVVNDYQSLKAFIQKLNFNNMLQSTEIECSLFRTSVGSDHSERHWLKWEKR